MCAKGGHTGHVSHPESFRVLPELEPLLVPVDSLTPNPHNARAHGERNLEAIRNSLSRFGQRKPIVANRDGTVEAGDGLLAAARSLGWTQVAVTWADDDAATAAAYGIADNRTAELAEWDISALKDVMLEFPHDDLIGWEPDDIIGLGFEVPGFAENVAPPKEDPPVPDPPKDPITKPGSLWVLGDHRLLCGDCRNPDDVARIVGDRKVNLAFTSPPYASQRKYDEGTEFKPIPPDEYVAWFEAVQANVREHLTADGSWFVNIKEHCDDGQRSLYVKDLTIAHVRKWGWRFVDELCWERIGLPGRYYGRFKNAWEPVFHFATSNGFTFHPERVGHRSSSVPVYSLETNLNPVGSLTGVPATREQSRDRSSARETREGIALPSNRLPPFSTDGTEHSAAFPVGLPSFFVRAYTDVGDVVLDPFAGSGSTLLAATNHDRQGLAIEISPGYCDVICERWEALTGSKATRP